MKKKKPQVSKIVFDKVIVGYAIRQIFHEGIKYGDNRLKNIVSHIIVNSSFFGTNNINLLISELEIGFQYSVIGDGDSLIEQIKSIPPQKNVSNKFFASEQYKEELLYLAFKYAIRRKTLAVCDVSKYLIANSCNLTQRTKEEIVRQIQERHDMFELSDLEFVNESWDKVKECLKQ